MLIWIRPVKLVTKMFTNNNAVHEPYSYYIHYMKINTMGDLRLYWTKWSETSVQMFCLEDIGNS